MGLPFWLGKPSDWRQAQSCVIDLLYFCTLSNSQNCLIYTNNLGLYRMGLTSFLCHYGRGYHPCGHPKISTLTRLKKLISFLACHYILPLLFSVSQTFQLSVQSWEDTAETWPIVKRLQKAPNCMTVLYRWFSHSLWFALYSFRVLDCM